MHSELNLIKQRGTFVIVTAFVMAGAWLALAPISKTVTASGMLKVSEYKKVIRHPNTATVTAIHVQDGEHVLRGQRLLSLENSTQLANLNNLTTEIFAEQAKISRLQSEINGKTAIAFDSALISAAKQDDNLAKILSQENLLFKSRMALQTSMQQNIRDSLQALSLEIQSRNSRLSTIQQSRAIAEHDLENFKRLKEENFFSENKVNEQRRIVNDYIDRQQEAYSDIAQARQRLAQHRTQLAEIQDNFISNSAAELKEASKRLATLQASNLPANQSLKDTTILSPVNGTVMGLKVHTTGSAIGALDALLEIVPDSQQMGIDARLDLNSIRHIRLNQQAEIRFPALPVKSTPLIKGTSTYIATDATIDSNSGEADYAIKVSPLLDATNRVLSRDFKPGMLAEIYIQTGHSTPLQYLMEPLRDAVPKAFRES